MKIFLKFGRGLHALTRARPTKQKAPSNLDRRTWLRDDVADVTGAISPVLEVNHSL